MVTCVLAVAHHQEYFFWLALLLGAGWAWDDYRANAP
jgi:hypothetical protein